jgi:hypothetical protein
MNGMEWNGMEWNAECGMRNAEYLGKTARFFAKRT